MLSPENPTLRRSQADTLERAAAGGSAAEIAADLGVSAKAVSESLMGIRRRLGCANTVEAVAVALMHRLIDPARVRRHRQTRQRRLAAAVQEEAA